METLVLFVVVTFAAFAGVDYWVIMTKHTQAEHLMNRYLARMAVEGRLSVADEQALAADFNAIGAPLESIEGPRESRGSPRVLRNPADLDGSTVSLRITARPTPAPLLIGRLIGGGEPGGGYRLVVGGKALSERVTP